MCIFYSTGAIGWSEQQLTLAAKQTRCKVKWLNNVKSEVLFA